MCAGGAGATVGFLYVFGAGGVEGVGDWVGCWVGRDAVIGPCQGEGGSGADETGSGTAQDGGWWWAAGAAFGLAGVRG